MLPRPRSQQQRSVNQASSRSLRSASALPSTESLLITDEEFCAGLVNEIVDKILDDQFEKYHEAEVIPWTVEYFGELLKDTLSFAFVDCDLGADLEIDSYLPDNCVNDIFHGGGGDGDDIHEVEDEVLSEYFEHRFVDSSWLEDCEEEIPVAPLDNWATGGVPVTQIIHVECEGLCENHESSAEKMKEGEGGDDAGKSNECTKE